MKQFKPIITSFLISGLLLFALFVSVSHATNAVPTLPTRFTPAQIILSGDELIMTDVGIVFPYLVLVDSFNVPITNPQSVFTIALYDITGGNTITSTINDVRTFYPNGEIQAEPNFLVVGMGDYHITGSPNAPPILEMPAFSFPNQWAFQPAPGINLQTSTTRTISYTGNMVKVGVFDTSPFIYSVSPTSHVELLPNNNAFSVWHMQPSSLITGTMPAFSGHGTAVASLIDHVAPNSNIHLYRILNEYGIGELYTLLHAINAFQNQVQGSTGIMNFSLGVLADPTLYPTLYALQLLMNNAYANGIVSVGATGNYSTRTISGGEVLAGMQMPAFLPTTLAVAAHRQSDGIRSCFSSLTNGVSAPGGDGIADGDNLCAAPVVTNTAYTNCVVGYDPNSTTNFSCSTGSSFATPLVAGIAALVVEKGVTTYAGVTPDEVYCAIRAGATLAEATLAHGWANTVNALLSLDDIKAGTNACGRVQLAIAKTAPANVLAGDPIVYTLHITNSGSLDAAHVVVQDWLPANANYLSGGTLADGVVEWVVEVLPAFSHTTVTFTVTATQTISNNFYQVRANGDQPIPNNTPIVTTITPILPITLSHSLPDQLHISWATLPNNTDYTIFADTIPYASPPTPINTTQGNNTTVSTGQTNQFLSVQAVDSLGEVTAITRRFGVFYFTLQN
jgi:uncharacterized repeat protein (TIGR01451 family)